MACLQIHERSQRTLISVYVFLDGFHCFPYTIRHFGGSSCNARNKGGFGNLWAPKNGQFDCAHTQIGIQF